MLGAELHPDAILFRNRSGNPYREDTLADDFRAVRQAVFPAPHGFATFRNTRSHSRRCGKLRLSAKNR
jgi:hypothetical protein